MSKATATLIGFTAVLMWALLALFTAASGRVPPFQLLALTMGLGGLIGVASWAWRPGAARALVQPWPVWLLGVGGLFGYHFFYYTALRNAPPVEAGLIAYLWPLLIVVFSALLPGERLRWFHIAGSLLGLFGTALIVTGGRGFAFNAEYTTGYLAAAVCALTWSTYSVVSRRFASVPTDAVAGFCLAGAILSALCHVVFEETVWPADAGEWLAVAGLGLMPVGAAFYVWDIGVKKGDIQVLGAASYAAPPLSTLILIAFGFGQATWPVVIACLAITGGAALAAKDMLKRRSAVRAAQQ
ncbi:drug/metabolite transporter (DMT)-like permease [Rhodobium orientis]|uniref:EamA family transporter n=1 Tax=Rhodobium orientis TaxID=34017 RepID=A0A327JSP5_9HYPH|nr:EamA family transporter [Rhodobium orientis]MBB4303679.1 drug/metabolite transporter (DMT)-like permease [Rhodobium orientis]MBK5951866.1 EamA family transporter [Rhodobium orientis]RAI28473.1 EamA family transporter [Rhodobium orientis]